MTNIQVNLTDDNNETVMITKVMQKFKTKEEAVNYIIAVYSGQMK